MMQTDMLMTLPRGSKSKFMLNSAEHEIFPAIIVVNLTFMSGENGILGLS